MEPLRLGIIGCGVIGEIHADAAAGADEVEVVAVADLDGAAARRVAERHGVPRVYGGASELIADEDVEAVVLALTTGVRAPLALASLGAGKHVLLEKPPAMDAGELLEMKARQGDRTVGCCSSRLTFLAGAGEAREIVDSGRLGALRVVRCRGLAPVAPVPEGWTPPRWRVSRRLNGGGYMVNWGIYDLDYLMHVTGWRLKPRVVLAQTWPIAPELADGRVDPDSDAENHVISMVRCDDGAVIVHERGEAVAMAEEQAWQITGTAGSLRLQMIRGTGRPTVVLDQAHPSEGLRTQVVLDDPGEDVLHTMPVRDFAAAIRDGRPPRTGLDKALVLQRVLDAIYQSARSGTAVTIET
jgi:predicted dehydrogenase